MTLPKAISALGMVAMTAAVGAAFAVGNSAGEGG
jgi:hypothetical protein